MYKDCKHHGGWEHRDVHNMYGFYNVSVECLINVLYFKPLNFLSYILFSKFVAYGNV